MELFDKRAVRNMTGQDIQRHWGGSWTYPNYKELGRTSGLISTSTYIQRRKRRLKIYIETYSKYLLQEAMENTRQSRNESKLFSESRNISLRKI